MQASWIRLDGFIPANRFVLRLERGGSNLLIGSAIPQASKHAMKHAPKTGSKPTQPTPAYFVSSFLVWCCVCLLSVGRANLSDNQTQKDFPPQPCWSFSYACLLWALDLVRVEHSMSRSDGHFKVLSSRLAMSGAS